MAGAPQPPGANRRRLTGLLALALLLAPAARGGAESGVQVVVPQQRFDAKGAPQTSALSGLILGLDSRWSCTYGYRPVRLTFTCPTPVNADRSLTVVYRTYHAITREPLASVEQDVDLPAGANSVEMTMHVPQLSVSQPFSWDVWVDGVRDPDLSCDEGEQLQPPPTEIAAVNFLTLPNNTGRANPMSWWRLGRGVLSRKSPRVGPLPLGLTTGQLPEEWLSLSGIDVVRLSMEQLVEQTEKHPERVDTLRRWVQSGGALWIEAAGDGLERLPEINELLSLDRGPGCLPNAESSRVIEGADRWEWAEVKIPKQMADALVFSFDDQDDSQAFGVPVSDDDDGTQKSSYFRLGVAERRHGFGVVAAFPQKWDARLAQSGTARSGTPLDQFYASYLGRHRWVERHGLAPDAANSEFSYLLIPDVGLAPVTAFRVLITAFVLVAGPLNFWLLRRCQRAQLMVITVPLTSLALTVGLFVYALVSDGFGVRVRARSVAMIDQTRGEQTVWSRNCYYAGLAPPDGLAFGADTAVYPLLPGWDDPSATGALARERTVEWRAAPERGLDQGLARGWLPPRQSTQLLTVTSGPTQARVDIDAGGGGVTATNRLGADAVLLIVVDADRSYWMAERAREGRAAPLEAVELNEAIAALRKQVSENEPLPPIGLEQSGDNAFVEQQRRDLRRRMQGELGIEYAPISAGANLLNQMLDRLTGSEGSDPLALPARSYVAVTEETVAAPLGAAGATESNSFHVVIGRWE